MRKPLAVVCVAASAVLLAGAVAATTAGAETSPDQPEVPGVALPEVPDVAGVPQLPSGAGHPSLDLPGLVAQAQDQADQGHNATRDRPSPGDADPQRPVLQRPDQDRPDQHGPGQDRPDQDRPHQDRPDQDRPHRDRPRPAISAHQDVTRASVSDSVHAPVQRQVLALVNENRRRGGCDDLTPDRRLIVAANRHAADMARRGYFAHSSPNGDGAGDRVADAGYDWSRYGENIARGQTSAYEVVDGWMHSPEHRANIMDCRLHQMGIGLAFAGDGEPYWVQDFATPDR